MHNYYAQPIYYTGVSQLCESLTDWSIPLKRLCMVVCFYFIYVPVTIVEGMLSSKLCLVILLVIDYQLITMFEISRQETCSYGKQTI